MGWKGRRRWRSAAAIYARGEARLSLLTSRGPACAIRRRLCVSGSRRWRSLPCPPRRSTGLHAVAQARAQTDECEMQLRAPSLFVAAGRALGFVWRLRRTCYFVAVIGWRGGWSWYGEYDGWAGVVPRGGLGVVIYVVLARAVRLALPPGRQRTGILPARALANVIDIVQPPGAILTSLPALQRSAAQHNTAQHIKQQHTHQSRSLEWVTPRRRRRSLQSLLLATTDVRQLCCDAALRVYGRCHVGWIECSSECAATVGRQMRSDEGRGVERRRGWL